MNKRFFSLALAAVTACSLMISCGSKSEGTTGNSADSTGIDQAQIEYNGKIVYVQMDSIIRGYGMAIDLQAKFNEKGTKAEAELQAKARSFERDYRDLQDKAGKGLLTSYQISNTEASLQKRQQDLVTYRDRVGQELAEEEQVMMNQISLAIMDFLKKYNAEKGYSMIVSSLGSNTVLVADPSLNITDDVLEGLNAAYNKSLGAKPAADTTVVK